MQNNENERYKYDTRHINRVLLDKTSVFRRELERRIDCQYSISEVIKDYDFLSLVEIQLRSKDEAIKKELLEQVKNRKKELLKKINEINSDVNDIKTMAYALSFESFILEIDGLAALEKKLGADSLLKEWKRAKGDLTKMLGLIYQVEKGTILCVKEK